MQNKISILYYVKRTKPNSIGQVPIYSRITVDGKRFEMSINRFIEPNKWSSEANKMRGNTYEARSINSHLDNLKIKVNQAEKILTAKDIEITSDTLNNELFGVKERARTLIPIFEEHNRKIQEFTGN